jgi:hypothetical protein
LTTYLGETIRFGSFVSFVRLVGRKEGQMEQPEEKARQIEAEIGTTTLDNIRQQIEAELGRAAAAITTASAWIDHYLLIDFGFTPNTPYEPNSV